MVVEGGPEEWLTVGCPRCSMPVTEFPAGAGHTGWACPQHGSVVPLWRAREPSYEGFAVQLRTAAGFPTYLSWPVSPGWRISDFAVVGDGRSSARATMTCASGVSELDGPVDLTIVAEEPGTGLGARCAGVSGHDPGPEVGRGLPAARVRVGRRTPALWVVSVSGEGETDRSVLVGEAAGRWLWVILRPASALLLWHDDWILSDVSGLGPALIDLDFGGTAPSW
jgi:hypothetical protein